MTSTDCQQLIICQRSEYFHRLCGPGSHFAESKQSEIELKDVDSQAMQLLLQHLYSIEPDPFQAPWRTWLNLRTTADKYPLSALRKLADTSLRSAVGCITNADSIFTIIRTLETKYADDDALTALAKSLRRENLHKLLRNARYRAYLDEDRSRLWKQLEELSFAAHLQEKTLSGCKRCGKLWWGDRPEAVDQTCPATQVRNVKHDIMSLPCWTQRTQSSIGRNKRPAVEVSALPRALTEAEVHMQELLGKHVK